ncbi:MAG: hypothetical protein EF806_06770 [Candidatus Methanoliparum thermophilum]|uniref:Phospholipase n=1 Tax=Methanoliparum thermophilum TaxID=2491083 RepID=A0A520KQS6_METT2|nr:phosphatidylserine/phosphatidylglycerophosphate/cardiolipin synthase family protein [Candidatus Methanoliparum sp. LAM-1]RZN63925.1 MAG: hypothetical protein EF806_06770 [Candidatus Methanoliparum thermophilum]BDC36345.1 hypothetical protein MTLP_10270 [Candidatus Methanoliparum sp. LAM-1]
MNRSFFVFIILFIILALAGLSCISIASQSKPDLLIYEVYPNTYSKNELDEFVSIINNSNHNINLKDYSITDLEGVITLPDFLLHPGDKYYWAYSSDKFKETMGFYPDFSHEDDGQIRLANNGDEVILKKGNIIVDVLVYGNSTYLEGWSGEPVSKPKEGEILRRNSLIDHDSREDWEKSNDKKVLLGLTNFKPEKFEFDGEVTAFVSPDSSFVTLTDIMSKAEDRIYIYVYTVDNLSLLPFLKNASENGVDIKLMVEKSPAGGMSDNELEFLYHIENMGGEVRLAEKPYVFNHQKLIIIDDCVIISSENLGYSGIPVDNTYGNRGFWIAIHNKEVTDYYMNLFNKDWNITNQGFVNQKTSISSLNYTPSGDYRPKYDPKTINGHFVVYPVIGPDFSFEHNPVLDSIKNAEDKILVEIFYIDLLWKDNVILEELINASRRGIEVYILLDSSDYNTEYNKIDNDDFVNFIKDLEKEGYPIHAKLIDKNRIFKLHNKSMIIDDAVFISSFNWNKNSFLNNREVGVLIENKDLSKYYEEIFWDDWGRINYGSFVLIISVFIVLVLYIGYKLIYKKNKQH